MPIYSYTCSQCGFAFDKRFASFDPAGSLPCPVCEAKASRAEVYSSNFRMGKAPPPKEWKRPGTGMADYKERIEYEQREHKKHGWDGDRAVEAVRKGRVEGDKGLYGFDVDKARKADA